MRVCVTYDELCTYNESEGGRYGSWSESYSSSVTGAYMLKDGEDGPYESETFLIPDDAKEVYVVHMIYSTGDSFGHADGKIDIVHCCVSEEAAHEVAKMIVENKNTYSFAFTDDFGRHISIDNRGAGYFESIDHVEVQRFTLGQKTRYTVN